MTNEFIQRYIVTPEIAKALRELGFNEPCLGFYMDGATSMSQCSAPMCENQFLAFNCYAAPLYQQAIQWLIENHDLSVTVQSYKNESIGLFYGYFIHNQSLDMEHLDRCHINKVAHSTYSAAGSAAISEALSILKQQQNTNT